MEPKQERHRKVQVKIPEGNTISRTPSSGCRILIFTWSLGTLQKAPRALVWMVLTAPDSFRLLPNSIQCPKKPTLGTPIRPSRLFQRSLIAQNGPS